jgi:putative GTP pyrophosphokinase
MRCADKYEWLKVRPPQARVAGPGGGRARGEPAVEAQIGLPRLDRVQQQTVLPAGVPSKSAVNRAGRLWAEFISRGTRRVPVSQLQELILAERMISAWRDAHSAPLVRVAVGLRYYTPVNKGTGQRDVTQRLKKFATIISKLQRQPTMQLTQMVDIGGCRALFNDQSEVDQAVGRMQRNWGAKIVRVKNYVENPKATGYRAVHLHVRHSGRMIEVQLRTPIQDVWAKFVENEERRLSRRKWLVKDGRGPDELLVYYRATAELFAMIDRGDSPDEAAIRRVAAAQAAASDFLPTRSKPMR